MDHFNDLFAYFRDAIDKRQKMFRNRKRKKLIILGVVLVVILISLTILK